MLNPDTVTLAEKYDAILTACLGSGKGRPTSQIHGENGVAVATNGHIMCVIEGVGDNYPTVDHFPDHKRLLLEPFDSIPRQTIHIDGRAEFTEWQQKAMRKKLVDCPECCRGLMTCHHCDSEYNCKNCGGSGDLWHIPAAKTEFLGYDLPSDRIFIILHTMKILGVKSFSWAVRGDSLVHLFQFDKVTMLTSANFPLTDEDDEDAPEIVVAAKFTLDGEHLVNDLDFEAVTKERFTPTLDLIK